jgi:hypothetical protein
MDTTLTRVGTADPTTSRTTTFRRRAGAATVFLAPIALVAAELSYPTSDEADPAASLGVFATHHAALLTSVYAMLAAALLFVPAVFALMNPVRGRGTALTHVGGAMVLAGLLMAKVGLLGAQLFFYEASAPGVDRAAAGHLIEHAGSDQAWVPLLIGHYLFALGIIVLAGGLFRARVGYRWAPALLALGPVLEIVLSSVGVPESNLLTAAVYGLVAVGFAGLAWWLVTSSNGTWESAGDRSAPPTAVAA